VRLREPPTQHIFLARKKKYPFRYKTYKPSKLNFPRTYCILWAIKINKIIKSSQSEMKETETLSGKFLLWRLRNKSTRFILLTILILITFNLFLNDDWRNMDSTELGHYWPSACVGHVWAIFSSSTSWLSWKI